MICIKHFIFVYSSCNSSFIDISSNFKKFHNIFIDISHHKISFLFIIIAQLLDTQRYPYEIVESEGMTSDEIDGITDDYSVDVFTVNFCCFFVCKFINIFFSISVMSLPNLCHQFWKHCHQTPNSLCIFSSFLGYFLFIFFSFFFFFFLPKFTHTLYHLH